MGPDAMRLHLRQIRVLAVAGGHARRADCGGRVDGEAAAPESPRSCRGWCPSSTNPSRSSGLLTLGSRLTARLERASWS